MNWDFGRCIHLPMRVRLAPAMLALSVLLLSTAPVQRAAAAPGDAVADRVFGQGGSFTTNDCNKGGISASSLCVPWGVAVDAGGNLYVADWSNKRVLEYDSPLTTDTVADRVFGQPDFTTSTCNYPDGGASASNLCAPAGVATDASGNVYVSECGVDSNNRVLEYNSPLTTDMVADRVFGQPDFTSSTCNTGGGVSASTLCYPASVAVDAAGNLFVDDNVNQRALEYDSPLTTDTVADRVFGQGGSFTTSNCNKGGISASSLCYPVAVGVDGAGHLYVADDNGGGRLLEYDSPLTTDTVADRVFGQAGSFTTQDCNKGGISASSLCLADGVAVDGRAHLYVADFNNNRVLEYDSPLTADTVADRVFGQPDFTTSTCNYPDGGVSASSLCEPRGVAVDAAGNLYVADWNNNRVLEYDTPLGAPVGGIAELPALAGASPEEAGAPGDESGWSAGGYAALTSGVAAAAVAIAAGAWYARRRSHKA
jgi:sugar lactone lactonase YvrE